MRVKKMQLSNIKSKKLFLSAILIATLLLFASCWSLNSSTNCKITNSPLTFSPLTNTTPNHTNKNTPNLPNLTKKQCDYNQSQLKIYMYDLPPMFHFGMLGWKPKNPNQIWPDVSNHNQIPKYPGGLNLQHSIEYWLILDLLSSNIPNFTRPCFAYRVSDPKQADLFFVPFFSSLSYNRHSKLHGKEKISKNRFLQDELVKYLLNKKEWKKSGGRDHLVPAHHPNSMLDARKKLGSTMFLLADFGRYPFEIANLKKDLIAPYKHVVKSVGNESAGFDERPILAYFQGAIFRKDGGMIRQKLHEILNSEPDIHFSYGTIRQNGIKTSTKGMSASKFCLNIAGDTPSSNRLFDSIVSHCVPVIISDEIELPFEDALDYSEFCLFVRGEDAIRPGRLVGKLRGVKKEEWVKMWVRLREVGRHFEYGFPSEEGDAVDMIWRGVERKMAGVRLEVNRKRRFDRLKSRG
ncbi:hypothetical protein LUZ60_003088 [Juncus effusus]|nr:hypothetical protein LUZ60_003088 [Juncus effusus]